MKKILYYLPRVLTVGIVIFLYLFVLEGFSPEFGWQSGLSHFILATIVLLIGIVAWKKPKIGGWLFLAPLLISLVLMQWRLLAVSSFSALIGVLYLVEGYNRKNNSNIFLKN